MQLYHFFFNSIYTGIDEERDRDRLTETGLLCCFILHFIFVGIKFVVFEKSQFLRSKVNSLTTVLPTKELGFLSLMNDEHFLRYLYWLLFRYLHFRPPEVQHIEWCRWRPLHYPRGQHPV